MPLPVKQYCYFAIYSESTSAAEMAAFLGLEPDKVLVRGSGMTEPVVVPKFHSWSVNAEDTTRPLDEQVVGLIARLRPYTARIAELAGRLSDEDPLSGASLQIVRYFPGANGGGEKADSPGGADGAEGAGASGGDTAVEAGWYLDREVVAFLAATRASLGVDEYDMSQA